MKDIINGLISLITVIAIVFGIYLFTITFGSGDTKNVINNAGAKIFGSFVDVLDNTGVIDYRSSDVTLFDAEYEAKLQEGYAKGYTEDCYLRHFKNASDPDFMWVCPEGFRISSGLGESPDIEDNRQIGYNVVCRWNNKPVSESVLSNGKRLIVTVNNKAYDVCIGYAASKDAKKQLYELYPNFPVGTIVRAPDVKFLGDTDLLWIRSNKSWYYIFCKDQEFATFF